MIYDRISVFIRRWFPWSPLQRCMVCGNWFLDTLPCPAWPPSEWRRNFWQWLPAWADYCSKQCSDDDLDFIDSIYDGSRDWICGCGESDFRCCEFRLKGKMMISFIDGPATGEVLALKRAPQLLRVVVDCTGGVDALDQLDDEPQPTERIYVYELVGEARMFHVCRSPRSQSGLYALAEYRLYATQPAETLLRDTNHWREWATLQQLPPQD